MSLICECSLSPCFQALGTRPELGLRELLVQEEGTSHARMHARTQVVMTAVKDIEQRQRREGPILVTRWHLDEASGGAVRDSSRRAF